MYEFSYINNKYGVGGYLIFYMCGFSFCFNTDANIIDQVEQMCDVRVFKIITS